MIAQVASTKVTALGAEDGTATVTVFGANGAVSYEWDAAASSQAVATATGLDVGNFMFTVTDQIGCVLEGEASIGQEVTCNIVSNVNVTQLSTAGGSEGAIVVDVFGQQGVLTYSWDHDNSLSTGSASGLPAGVYTLTVSDNILSDCALIENVTISEFDCTLSASLSGTNLTSNASGDGSVTVTAPGGVSTVVYTWSHSGTETGSEVSGLDAGVYSVTATDEALCTSVATITITEPTCDVTVEASVLNDSTVAATVLNGQGNITLLWSNGATTPTTVVSGGATYTVTVTDDIAAGCTATSSVYLTGIGSATTVNYSIYPNPNNGSFAINFSNNNDTYTVSVRNVIGQVILNKTIQVSGSHTEAINLNN